MTVLGLRRSRANQAVMPGWGPNIQYSWLIGTGFVDALPLGLLITLGFTGSR
jgi:hypothetical protein